MSTREITLEGGSPWGFRIHGGADTNQPLRVSRVSVLFFLFILFSSVFEQSVTCVDVW